MPDPAPNPPLWRVMRDSAIGAIMRPAGLRATSARQEAARLRAIAEEVWNRGLSGEAVDYGDIFNWLHAEADRAEVAND